MTAVLIVQRIQKVTVNAAVQLQIFKIIKVSVCAYLLLISWCSFKQPKMLCRRKKGCETKIWDTLINSTAAPSCGRSAALSST